MPFAHKPVTLIESDRTKLTYCSVCGQEDLSGACYGIEIDQKFVNDQMEQDFRKIFLDK